jgi:hypothetical protein
MVINGLNNGWRIAVHGAQAMLPRQTPTKKENMKTKSSLVIGTCIATLVLCAPASAPAKTKAAASPAPTASPAESAAAMAKKPRPIPYHGKVASVDAGAKTFSLAGKESTRMIKITDQSTITKQGVAAAMADIVADEEVRGSYWKKEDGSLEARTVKLGPLTAEEMAKRDAHKKKKAAAAAEPSPSPAQ